MAVDGVEASADLYAEARELLARAHEAQARLGGVWESFQERRPFRVNVSTDDGGRGAVVVSCDWPDGMLDEASSALDDFATCAKRALDSSVWVTARTACAAFSSLIDEESHRFPVCTSAEQFDEHVADGNLMGLRLDQLHRVRDFQAYATGSENAEWVGERLAAFAGILTAVSQPGPSVRLWFSGADPVVRVAPAVVVERLALEPDGAFLDSTLVATFQLAPPKAAAVAANPRVRFSLVAAASPWPSETNGVLLETTEQLLILFEDWIRLLEESVEPSLVESSGGASGIPEITTNFWRAVSFESPEDEEDARAAVEASDTPYATHRADDGTLTVRTLRDGEIVAMQVPPASAIDPEGEHGFAAESAALASAAEWGLPDLVFAPRLVAKGSGRREIGDGTIVASNRGLALQSKAREARSADAEREGRWLIKKAQEALRQARGTIRLYLSKSAVNLTNHRGREVTIAGEHIEWLPVAILDHEMVPADVAPPLLDGQPSVVLTRRDWDFLWDHLRSATAVVDYLFRVSNDPAPLGEEAVRYLELATADSEVEHSPKPAKVPAWDAVPMSDPVLPIEPASSSDEFGHLVFRRILQDVAECDFNAPESVRLNILSMLDRVAVSRGAELGRLLLQRLDECALAPVDQTRWRHRSMVLGSHELHLAFSTCRVLTTYHQRLYEGWFRVRRHQFVESLPAGTIDLPWSVAVLLTPSPDADRVWDTTLMASNQRVPFDAGELEQLENFWSPTIGNSAS